MHHGVDGPANRARGAARSSVRAETGSIAMISMRLKQREGPKAAREFAAKKLAAAAPTPAEIAHQASGELKAQAFCLLARLCRALQAVSVARSNPTALRRRCEVRLPPPVYRPVALPATAAAGCSTSSRPSFTAPLPHRCGKPHTLAENETRCSAIACRCCAGSPDKAPTAEKYPDL